MMKSLEDAWKVAVEKGLSPNGVLLVVDAKTQRLFVQLKDRCEAMYVVSTSRKGLGSEADSQKTPPGFHKVVEWIGKDEPLGRRFESREPLEELVLPEGWLDPGDTDWILSRILRLEGLEPGVNQGPGIDSYERFIYLHGTNHEDQLGEATSGGCIRLANHDIADLYDRTEARETWCWVGEME